MYSEDSNSLRISDVSLVGRRFVIIHQIIIAMSYLMIMHSNDVHPTTLSSWLWDYRNPLSSGDAILQ